MLLHHLYRFIQDIEFAFDDDCIIEVSVFWSILKYDFVELCVWLILILIFLFIYLKV
jgi:hypothetical protein